VSVPMCPTHGSAMRAGKNGGFFCPRKMPDQTYCTQRIKAVPGPVAAPSLAAEPQTTPRHLMVIAALDFASRVYQGTAQDQGAMALASEVLLIYGGDA
jgi:hypothetical protein